MKKINNYILEKLHISKGMNTRENEKILNLILGFCQFNGTKYEKIKSIIDNWIQENDVNEITMYVNDAKNTLKHINKLPEEISKKVQILEFNLFYSLYTSSFPKGAKFDNFLLYTKNDIDIYAFKDVLNINCPKFLLLIQKVDEENK